MFYRARNAEAFLTHNRSLSDYPVSYEVRRVSLFRHRGDVMRIVLSHFFIPSNDYLFYTVKFELLELRKELILLSVVLWTRSLGKRSTRRSDTNGANGRAIVTLA